MEDKRQNLRRHIQAARDWLLEADNSLERKNDLQSDLKLMLAKAELEHAEKHQNRKYLSTILPLTVATLIALIFFLDREPISNDVANSQVIPTTPAYIIAPEPQTIDKSAPQVAIVEPESIPKTNVEVDSIVDIKENIKIESQTSTLPEPAETLQNFEILEPPATVAVALPQEPQIAEKRFAQEPNIPSEDMQQLMQSAGKILRAK